MLKAARAQGRPMIVIAMMTAAMIQPNAIHRPPNRIQSRFRTIDTGDIGRLRAYPPDSVRQFAGQVSTRPARRQMPGRHYDLVICDGHHCGCAAAEISWPERSHSALAR